MRSSILSIKSMSTSATHTNVLFAHAASLCKEVRIEVSSQQKMLLTLECYAVCTLLFFFLVDDCS